MRKKIALLGGVMVLLVALAIPAFAGWEGDRYDDHRRGSPGCYVGNMIMLRSFCGWDDHMRGYVGWHDDHMRGSSDWHRGHRIGFRDRNDHMRGDGGRYGDHKWESR